ncbi:MAG: site-specific integrase [Phycisphaerales bacterium]|nr:site-specific integrase [Phycisphaerales bacterium]
MGWIAQYQRAKPALLADASICPENRELFRQFFEFEEYKLKRQNGLAALDEGCGNTLYGYTIRLRNVNRWFANKPWQDLTREDIKQVYDALEDGSIRNQRGEPFRDPAAYYNKIFKSKPFRLAGKAELAREVIEFSTTRNRVVNFVTEEQFRRLVSVIPHPRHLLLLWLAWDIGENINTLLQLTNRDFMPQVNKYTGDREYVVHLPAEKLKRSRQERSENTLYPETAMYTDMVLANAGTDDRLFPFGYRQANKLIATAARKTGATTLPNGRPVRWKDLRSGMACHLLRTGWNREEVNARLGHTPQSDALDAYINFLALDRNAPKQRMQEFQASLGRQAALASRPLITPPRYHSTSESAEDTVPAPMLARRNELLAQLWELDQSLANTRRSTQTRPSMVG